MKLKNMWKRFWTLDVHNHAGFTLVELIIVIAILAILSTGAIAGYSAYVERANKTADKALIAEIKNVLTMAYYSGSLTEDVVITLSADGGVENVAEDSQLDKIMDDAYGTNWRNVLKLKYAGWSESFQGSNFYDSPNGMVGLLGTVDGLTSALEAFLDRSDIDSMLGAGGSFNGFMDSMGATDAASKSDAAVFYVADVTSKLQPEALQNAANSIVANSTGTAEDVLEGMNQHLGSSVASMAAMYALAEGYATFCDNNPNYDTTGNESPRQILDRVTANIQQNAGNYSGTVAAFSELMGAFGQMGEANPDAFAAYIADNGNNGSAMSKDLSAYADAMKTVAASKDSIVSNNGMALGTQGYFQSAFISDMFSAYSEGGVFIYAMEKDGAMVISSTIDDAK